MQVPVWKKRQGVEAVPLFAAGHGVARIPCWCRRKDSGRVFTGEDRSVLAHRVRGAPCWRSLLRAVVDDVGAARTAGRQ